MSRLLFSFVALASLVTAARAADEGPFAVKLMRPVTVGDVVNYDAHFAGTSEYSSTPKGVPGQPAPTTKKEVVNLKVQLNCRVETREVSKLGVPTLMVLRIDKLLSGEEQKPLADVGTLITVHVTEKLVTFTSPDGSPVAPGIKEVLQPFFPRLNPAGITSDDLYGSKTPRKVGETWNVDPDTAVKHAGPAVIDPKKYQGTTTLRSAPTNNGQPALEFVMTVAHTGWRPANFPAADTLLDSRQNTEEINLLPLDDTMPPLQWERTIDSYLSFVSTENQSDTIESRTHSHLKVTLTPAQK